MVYAPLVGDKNEWKVRLDDIKVNGKSVKIGDTTAIIDSGTTMFTLPPQIAEAVVREYSTTGSCSESV